ncbi:hypothetical protein DFQ27_001910 [Actinomortierella ambigua]|uniref:LysM domain-containing protein n=1 Tax=Actinomortierella ambigua TaxID=1343610 RepID=A0A9P6U6V7_9FUNG|nr:hypothetical protein DFQ27_001910 [Actinomortierella ambigua]
MKFPTTLVILAAVASSALAVVPRPRPGCKRLVMIMEGEVPCDPFAAKYGTTFAHLLKWNEKLRKDCKNLDVEHPICVDNPSIPLDMPDELLPTPTSFYYNGKVTYSGQLPVGTLAPKVDGPGAGSPPAPSTTPPPPKGGAPGNGSPSVPPVPPKVDADGAGTPSAPAPAPAPSGATSSTVSVPTPTGASRPASLNKPNSEGSTANADSSAGVNKGSLIVAAAGVVMSVAYML